MRAQVCGGIVLIIIALLALLIRNFLGLFPNMTETIRIILIALIPAMITSGGSLVWLGRKPDEQEVTRKRDIHAAIKTWVESSQKALAPYSLAAKAPELSLEVENCLSKKYPPIWSGVLELRHKRDEFLKLAPNDLSGAVNGRKLAMQHDIEAMQGQLVQRINSEILEKHFTRLKC